MFYTCFVACPILDIQGFLLCAHQAGQVYHTENLRPSGHPVKPTMFRIREKERHSVLERNVVHHTSIPCGNCICNPVNRTIHTWLLQLLRKC